MYKFLSRFLILTILKSLVICLIHLHVNVSKQQYQIVTNNKSPEQSFKFLWSPFLCTENVSKEVQAEYCALMSPGIFLSCVVM